jgi:glycosyltransferase involved in cell wall biosynthesis
LSEENKNPKKIGYVLKKYPRYSETFIVNEILAHEDAGLEIQIFSLTPSDDSHYQDIVGDVKAPVHYLSSDNPKAKGFWELLNETEEVLPGVFQKLELFRQEKFRYLYQGLELAKIVKLQKIEHLHSHFASSATNVARISSHFSNVPFSFTAHAKDIFHENTDFRDLQTKLRDASAVVTVSDYNFNYLQRTFGSYANSVRRIYNGMDLKKLSYRKPENRKPNIITIGRLIEKKGLDVLIDACAILAKKDLEFNCRIIGKGDLEPQLQAQINENQLQDKVELAGAIPRREVIESFYNAAVFAAPAIIAQDGNRDGLPTTLLESMALGTPCVATDVTGIPEIITDKVTGLSVEQNDPVGLANALEKLLHNPSLGVSLSENAHKLIELKFDISKNSAKIRENFAQNVVSKEVILTSDR